MNEEYLKHISTEITEEMKKFVDDEVFGEKEYLFVENINGINQGHCTKCHNEYELKQNYKHNSGGICPICGAKLQVKLSRYGRKNCKNDACFYYFEKSILDSNTIVCKGYYVTRDYIDYRNPTTEYLLEAIYLFSDKSGKMLKLNYSYLWGESWSEKKTVFDFNQGWLAPKMCYISRKSIRKATKGTRFQYIPSKLLQGYHSTVKVFDEFAKYPWLEQIYKIGFTTIVEDKITGGYLYNCLNYRGKDIFKIVRLSRKDVKDIKESKACVTPLFIKLYQMQIKDKSGLSPEEVKNIEDHYRFNFAKLTDVLKYTTMKKAFKYMEKQYMKFKEKYYNKEQTLTTWSDYIENCIELEMDLKDEKNLFPKDVYNSHQNTMKQIKVKGDALIDAKIKKRVEKLMNYYFENEGLCIRPALNVEDLIQEGKTLGHCVATNYTKPYASGQTDIFFIRKISDINTPYFTIEIKKNKIIQVQGKGHCKPSSDVEKFIKEFTAEKLSNKKSKVKISVPA